MEFASKEYLFLLILLIPYLIWYLLYRKKSEPTMHLPVCDKNWYGCLICCVSSPL